jgi:hypothetical protein
MTKEIHLCLVARQPTPILVPLLDQCMSPDLVILAHTAGFENQADWLVQALKIYGIKTERLLLPSHNDLPALREAFFELYQVLIKTHGSELVLRCNITTGTKPMSLALYELALMTEQDGVQAYYQNDDDTLSWFVPKNKPRTQIDDKVKLPAFLLAHGLGTLKKPSGTDYPEWRNLLKEILANLVNFRGALTVLNGLALSANRSNLTSNKDVEFVNPHLKTLLHLLQQHKLLRINGKKVIFASEEARFFCNGAWLEELVYHTVRQLSAKNTKIQDYAMGVEIESLTTGIRNELDGVVLVNNRLVIIECKTIRTKEKGKRVSKAVQDSLYKIDTLAKQVGGIHGRGILISMNPLSSIDKARAKLYQIDIIDGDMVSHLATHLAKLLN